MKKLTILKAFVLSMAMTAWMLSPMTVNAQNDGFFRGGDDVYYTSRDNVTIPSNNENGISNYGIGETVPLGSGLLVLTAVGVGYAISRRKRNLKYGAKFMLAFAMLIGMTNCKKNVETISNEATNGVHITLNLDDDNNGSEVIVNPTGHTNPNYATVTYESGDVIYVGNNGKYCGYLTHNGTNFSGTINPESEDDYLHFYFMGNKGPVGSQPSTVSITDQSDKYPVISYARSNQLYNSDVDTYSAKLKNYCAIVKFNTNGISTDTDIRVKGMNNTVSVDFSANNAAAATPTLGNNPYTPSKSNDGDIILHAESTTARWAILLEQSAVNSAVVKASGYYNSTCNVPAITNNMYNNTGVNITMTVKPLPEGAISGMFTINSSGDKVCFSKGNLQYNKSTQVWSFMEYQYTIVETEDDNLGENYANQNIVSLFGWGTTGYRDTRTASTLYQTKINPYSTSNTAVGSSHPAYNKNRYGYGPDYDASTQYNLSVTHKSDWGMHAISNGGNTAGLWRTLTINEWGWILGSSTSTPGTSCRKSSTVNNTSNARFTFAKIDNTHNGIIIFPDKYTAGTPSGVTWGTINDKSEFTTTCTTDGWEALETAGCVFIPCAGTRNFEPTWCYFAGYQGYYWSSSCDGASQARYLYFSADSYKPSVSFKRCAGASVRLVSDY